MSADAVGWAWKFSPFSGSRLLIHLAMADVVNDANANEFWMTISALAKKARTSRGTVDATLSEMRHMGLLDTVEQGGGRGKPTRYRMLMPDGGVTAQSSGGFREETAQSQRETAQSTGNTHTPNSKNSITNSVACAPEEESAVSASGDQDHPRTIAVGFHDWVVRNEGHPPVASIPNLIKRVQHAQKGNFTRREIKGGLKLLHGRGITITDQALRNAMQGKIGTFANSSGQPTDVELLLRAQDQTARELGMPSLDD